MKKSARVAVAVLAVASLGLTACQKKPKAPGDVTSQEAAEKLVESRAEDIMARARDRAGTERPGLRVEACTQLGTTVREFAKDRVVFDSQLSCRVRDQDAGSESQTPLVLHLALVRKDTGWVFEEAAEPVAAGTGEESGPVPTEEEAAQIIAGVGSQLVPQAEAEAAKMLPEKQLAGCEPSSEGVSAVSETEIRINARFLCTWQDSESGQSSAQSVDVSARMVRKGGGWQLASD